MTLRARQSDPLTVSGGKSEGAVVEMSQKVNVKRPLLWLAAIVMLAVTLRLAAFSGYEGGDDLNLYSEFV